MKYPTRTMLIHELDGIIWMPCDCGSQTAKVWGRHEHKEKDGPLFYRGRWVCTRCNSTGEYSHKEQPPTLLELVKAIDLT